MNEQELLILMKKEGNEKKFEYKGYDCLIVRRDMQYSGHLCGYIVIPTDHELYGMFYSDIEEKYDRKLPAHGGLTFSEYVDYAYGDFLIGFDCAHYRDMTLINASDEGAIYRDMEFVENNIKQIIDFIEERKS